VVFLDETAAKTNMARTHGYAPEGQRLEGDAPSRRRQTTTFLGALRAGGFVAPLVVDGAMTGDLLVADVGRVLANFRGSASFFSAIARTSAVRASRGLAGEPSAFDCTGSRPAKSPGRRRKTARPAREGGSRARPARWVIRGIGGVGAGQVQHELEAL
jgi:hypothetical protein